jgi:hypothetical protein
MQREGTWYVVWTDGNGRRNRTALKARTKAEACRIADELESRNAAAKAEGKS